jgi:hypothetical protein
MTWLYTVRLLGAGLPEFDFTRAHVCREWGTPHDISELLPTPQGLEVSIDGEDPYFFGPPRDYPIGKPLWLSLKVKSDQGGEGQVFFFRDQATEEASVRFVVAPARWSEVRLSLPALGPGYRLRIDPPGESGKATIASIRFELATALASPVWPQPTPISFAQTPTLQAGAAQLQVAKDGFRVLVDGHLVALSHSRAQIGYALGDKTRWLDLGTAQHTVSAPGQADGPIQVISTLLDPDAGTWRWTHVYRRSAQPGVFEAEITVSVDRERSVVFLPLLLLIAGQGEPSVAKQQALFAGLEYLENEPSSSEADVVGPEARRQVPANHKITFPLMAILREGRYAGVIWDQQPQYAALFDSPDRSLRTGGHLMGLVFPGSDGYDRVEGSLLPTRPQPLQPGHPLVLKAQLIAGVASNLVPAIQQYVNLRGLPPITPNGYSLPSYLTLAAHGWLDSKIREGDRYRHAVWSGFGAQPAADAAVWMDWLATQTNDPDLAARLSEAAQGALSMVQPQSLDSAAVSHVRYPLPALVYGQVPANAAAAEAHARALLARFNTDGVIPYRPAPGATDYGRTHFAPDANGFTAQVAAALLEAAAVSGQPELIGQALRRLRGLDKFRNSVPRGAQTWEIPLHTPDILASAYLVRAYTLGYELTGQQDFLAQALYWAWTGVPFVYLIAPTGFPDRPYGTISVYGATNWRAPVWFGRPVQWCGLVYADALYRLVRHDPAGPWKQLADGITSVGVYYSWPGEDRQRQGLLPDVWELVAQKRAGPAINPGTVQANALRLYGLGPAYDFRAVRMGARTLTIHAPGAISIQEVKSDTLTLAVRGWPRKPYSVLIGGLSRPPRLTLNAEPTPLQSPHLFQSQEGRLVLQVSGQPTLSLQLNEL